MSTASSSKPLRIVSWVLQVALAGVFIAMGASKLTGDEMSVELFTLVGAEPAGRYVVGLWELAAALLLLIPRTTVYGGLLAILGMLGAIGSHLFTDLGISPELESGEAPPLFIMAVALLVLGAVVTFLRRDMLPFGSGSASSSVSDSTPADAGE